MIARSVRLVRKRDGCFWHQRAAGGPHVLTDSEKHHSTINDGQLPFDVQVDAYYPNSEILGPFQAEGRSDVLRADAGELKDRVLADSPTFAGAGESKADIPAAYVTLLAHGSRIGRFALDAQYPNQSVQVDGKAYQIALRFHRYYNAYSIFLEKFTVDRYPGTNSPQGYSSMVRLVDPTRQVDREIRIWMNHPLRYYGKAFFQAGFDESTEKATILQVVTNPGWQIPYVACAIGAVGLATHFLLKLLEFLRKQAKLSTAAEPAPPTGTGGGPRRGKPSPRPVGIGKPALSWDRTGIINVAILLPAIVLLLCIALTVALSMPPVHHSDQPDIAAFGGLPIFQAGRLQPYDSLARNSLRIIHGHQVFEQDGKLIPATQWLLDFQDKPEEAIKQKVVTIDFKEISGLITSDQQQKYFSLQEILDHWPQLFQPLASLPQELSRNASMYERKLADLREHLFVYFQLNSERSIHYIASYPALPVESPAVAAALELPRGTTRATLADVFGHSQVITAMQDAEKTRKDSPASLTNDQKALVKLDLASRTLLGFLEVSTPLVVVPLKAEDQWMSAPQARAEEEKAGQPIESLAMLQDIHEQFAAGDAAKFNQAVAAYQARVSAALPSKAFTAEFEAAFNQADVFFTCVWLYVIAFILLALSWLGISRNWTLGFYSSATAVVALALLVHTVGLICRIYISGWGPVTNLTSSAIFIAWGIVVMAFIFDVYHRNGVFLVAATVAGVASLLIADGLAADGDTFKVLEPVLATQFWLWTHVIGVTLGYAATALACVLAVIYVVLAAARRLGKDDSRSMIRMIYGVICFGMLFSFVGTILGGIWADQSWGRFWGWDPKENGAVLVVLCNALLLHARWGGLAKARGIVSIALFGGIVVAWSWFGTNMLGIGLHAYGFTDMKRLYLLIAFVALQLFFIALNLLIPDPSDQQQATPIMAHPIT